jgi:ABC-2 type transport system ATP-binding protein
MTQPLAIETLGLTKHYGRSRGVIDLSFEVEPGSVFGFLGPNGAGKTTTIRLLLDLIRPTSGTAKIFGLESRNDGLEIRRRIGYLPSDPALYDDLTARQLLEFSGNLSGNVPLADIEGLARRLDLDLGRRIALFSRGNRQKTAIIRALMHQPDLLILDEPTSGLDPLAQQEFHQIMAEVRAEGRTVFFSSHILPEVERLCDRVGIIRDGRLVALESIAALKRKAVRKMDITFDRPIDAGEFRGLEGVKSCAALDSRIHISAVGSMDSIIKAAAKHTVVDIVVREASLEDVFFHFYHENGKDAK